MDQHTKFLDCFTHAGGKQTRSPQLKRNLIACLIGLSTNLGLHGMAASCGILYDVLAWTAEWYIREETLRERWLVRSGRPMGESGPHAQAVLPVAAGAGLSTSGAST